MTKQSNCSSQSPRPQSLLVFRWTILRKSGSGPQNPPAPISCSTSVGRTCKTSSLSRRCGFSGDLQSSGRPTRWRGRSMPGQPSWPESCKAPPRRSRLHAWRIRRRKCTCCPRLSPADSMILKGLTSSLGAYWSTTIVSSTPIASSGSRPKRWEKSIRLTRHIPTPWPSNLSQSWCGPCCTHSPSIDATTK